MTFPCVESTLDFVTAGFGVRVWIDEAHDAEQLDYDNDELKQSIRRIAIGMSQRNLARWIAEQPRINAVHVRDMLTGDGRVIYVNWP